MINIFSPGFLLQNSFFQECGINLHSNTSISSDFVIFNEKSLQQFNDYCDVYSIPKNNAKLLDKFLVNTIYQKYGLSIPNTVKPVTIQDIQNINWAGDLILKPVISYGGRGYDSSSVSQISYKKITKQTLLEVIEMDSNFWPNQQTDKHYIIQEFIEPIENTNHEVLILYGAINGAGDVYNANPSVGNKLINSFGFSTSVNTWCQENLTDEILNIQNKVNTMLVDEGVQNAFYNIQFIKKENNFVAHDFQYRFGYQELALSNSFNHRDYLLDLIKFTFGMSDKKPVQPFVTAMKLSGVKTFSSGSTKEEALAGLSNE
jgi:hypothetical protein